MIKKNLLSTGMLVIALIISSCNSKKNKSNDLENDKLLGKVKSIRTSLMSYYSDGIVEKGKTTNTLYNFDGFEIYNDEMGNIGGDDGEFSNSKTEIIRDINNIKLEEKTKILSGTTSYKSSIVKYSYDNKDNLIKKVYYYDGVIGNTIIYKNDESGNIIEESLINSSGNSSKTNYKYDKNNNLIEERRTGYTINYEYNSKGDINKETLIMDDEKSSSVTIYKYDSNGNKIKTSYINGGAQKEINYKYDLNNNLIEVNDNASGYIYNYEYDNSGNWIKEIKKSSDDTYIVERKIEYYSDDEDASNTQQNFRNGKYQYASERVLTSDEIANYDKYELKLIKNEIFARYGYIFKTAEMKAYFESQAWYQPKYNDVTSFLTEIEIRNINLINGSNYIENNNIERQENSSIRNNYRNDLTYGEIRGSIISGTKQEVETFLGQPDGDMSGLEYAQDVLGYKRLGVVWMERLIEYKVWIYNSPDNTGKELLVIFHCDTGGYNCKVMKVIYSENITDFRDLYN